MGHAKLSVTIPDEMYKEIKAFASKRNIKMSHIVTEALAEKARKIKEEALIQQINKVFEDQEMEAEQLSMANAITDNTDVEELPW